VASPSLRRRVALSLILLAAFAATAPVLRLTFVHDDGYNIPLIGTQSALSVFGFANYGHRDYRPLLAALWLLVRDLFGAFVPSIIHWWSLAVHTLVVALTMALALRWTRGIALPRTLAAALAGALTATFPFSHQAVHWAGAVGHPLMTMFGLAAMHCAMTPGRRAQLVGLLCLLCACWSHEQGFVFGALAPLALAAERFVQRRPLRRRDLLSGAGYALVALAYVGVYLLAVRTVWNAADQAAQRSSGLVDAAHALAFNMQAFIAGVVVALRYRLLDVFAPAQITPLLFAMFAATVAPMLIFLRRRGALRPGLAALACWFVTLAPSALYLNHSYIEGAVRILYPTAPGIAIFWAIVVGAILEWRRRPLPRALALAAPLAFIAWSQAYLGDRLHEFELFARGMRRIADAVARSPADARVLLINFPAASAPRDPGPAFLRGNEGVMFHTDFNGSPMILVNALTGAPRDAEHVVHDIGARQGKRFEYFAAGPTVDDGALRPKLLAANLIFRWEFDQDGPHAHQLAEIAPATETAPTVASLTLDDARIDVDEAALIRTADSLQLNVTWRAHRPPPEPVGIFVHLYDAQGQKIGQADADLISGYLPLDQLPAGLRLREQRRFALDAEAQPASVHIGVYRRSDGRRWRAARPDGAPLDGDEIVATAGE
jgi:hypothetical protein